MEQEKEAEGVSRFIDYKLPLPWLLSSAGVITFTLIAMFFKLERLGEDVTEMKASVRAGSAVSSTVQNEVAILRFRVESLEKKEIQK